jgi:hypothetical protein
MKDKIFNVFKEAMTKTGLKEILSKAGVDYEQFVGEIKRRKDENDKLVNETMKAAGFDPENPADKVYAKLIYSIADAMQKVNTEAIVSALEANLFEEDRIFKAAGVAADVAALSLKSASDASEVVNAMVADKLREAKQRTAGGGKPFVN